MKKIIIIATIAIMAFAPSASAQSGLSGLFGKLFGGGSSKEEVSATTDVVTNVLGSLLGNSMTLTEKALQGEWSYTGTACVLESDAALANIGGSVAAAKIEEKLDGYLAKVGVNEGVCSFTFVNSDSCVFSVAGRELGGKYTLDAKEKTIKFAFFDYLSFNTHVAYNITSMNIVFNADKLLSLVQAATSKASSLSGESALGAAASSGNISSTLSVVSSLLENYKGMMLGMKLKK